MNMIRSTREELLDSLVDLEIKLKQGNFLLEAGPPPIERDVYDMHAQKFVFRLETDAEAYERVEQQLNHNKRVLERRRSELASAR